MTHVGLVINRVVTIYEKAYFSWVEVYKATIFLPKFKPFSSTITYILKEFSGQKFSFITCEDLVTTIIIKFQRLLKRGWKVRHFHNDPVWISEHVITFSQFRLTSFVTLSAHAGYCVAGYPFVLSDFALLSAGTFLCSCSANVWNQLQEFPFDSQMDRTKSRPFIKKEISNLTGTNHIKMHWFLKNPIQGRIPTVRWIRFTLISQVT